MKLCSVYECIEDSWQMSWDALTRCHDCSSLVKHSDVRSSCETCRVRHGEEQSDLADKDLEFQVCMQDELDATTKRLDETQQQLQRTSAQLGKAHTDAAETARLMRAMHEHIDFLRDTLSDASTTLAIPHAPSFLTGLDRLEHTSEPAQPQTEPASDGSDGALAHVPNVRL